MTLVHEFDPYSDTFFGDPYDTYKWLRDDAPVYRNDHYGFYARSLGTTTSSRRTGIGRRLRARTASRLIS